LEIFNAKEVEIKYQNFRKMKMLVKSSSSVKTVQCFSSNKALARAYQVERSRVISTLKSGRCANSASSEPRRLTIRRSGPAGVDDLAKFDEDGNEIEEEVTVEMDWKGKFFGIYLQLGVWISVLSFAGYTGYKKILESAQGAEDVGLLIAPTSAAIFLILSFLAYNSVVNGKKDDE